MNIIKILSAISLFLILISFQQAYSISICSDEGRVALVKMGVSKDKYNNFCNATKSPSKYDYDLDSGKSDFSELSLDTGSRAAIGKTVYIAISKCFSPGTTKDFETGQMFPTVQCSEKDGGTVMATGSREKRLKLLKINKVWLSGKVVGGMSSTPIIEVFEN